MPCKNRCEGGLGEDVNFHPGAAIAKCLEGYSTGAPWQVAYLPIDPRDLGRSYDALIRINSQSGKGGMAYIIEREIGMRMPRWLQVDFSAIVQAHNDEHQSEITADELRQLFELHYLHNDQPWQLVAHDLHRQRGEREYARLELRHGRQHLVLEQQGHGALDALIGALSQALPEAPIIIEYDEHALSAGNDAQAVAFIQLSYRGRRYCAAGRSEDIVEASILAVLSALNRAVAAADGLAA